MTNLLARAIMMSTPLLMGSLAEVYAERTGMMICAIEGIFLIGAWGGFVGAYLSGSLLIGLLCAIAAGALMALLYAFVTVTLKQQQVVTGTAMNILAVGICAFSSGCCSACLLPRCRLRPCQSCRFRCCRRFRCWVRCSSIKIS